MEEGLLTISLTIIAISFLGVIALLGVTAINHGQESVAEKTMELLGEWIHSFWKK